MRKKFRRQSEVDSIDMGIGRLVDADMNEGIDPPEALQTPATVGISVSVRSPTPIRKTSWQLFNVD